MRRFAPLFAALVVLAAPASAQEPVTGDTVGRDTSDVTRLPDLNVTVTRSPEPLARVPFAVGVLNRDDLVRGQATLGIDEALNNLPGVVVANRYNFSLDQRISIRGFGSRSNFGVRGLKILVDGIPQTLPDGQSQLSNVDFADLERAEVLRGSSSSLYGNASGGVIAFQTQGAEPGPFAQRIRVQGGDGKRAGDGFYKWQSWTSGRSGDVSGTLSVSQFKADGFRQHSAAEFRQLNAGGDWVVSGSTIATMRLSLADNPEAQNPGALTRVEYETNPDSAAANNLRRGADKDVQQHQLSFGLRHFDAAGNEYSVSLFGLLRDLENPLAAPPDIGGGPTNGTYIRIDRQVAGIRLSAARALGSEERSPRLTAGVDLQRMRDDRENLVSDAGVPTSVLFLDQREKVTELGPFAQVQWSPNERLLVSGGARFDWVRFSLGDRFLDDGDDSGDRSMSALSGNVGAELVVRPAIRALRQRLDVVRDAHDDRAGEPARRLRRIQHRAGSPARGQLRGRGAGPAGAGAAVFRRPVHRPGDRRDRAAGRDRGPRVLPQRAEDPQRRRRGRGQRLTGPGVHAERGVHLRPLPVRRGGGGIGARRQAAAGSSRAFLAASGFAPA